MSFLARLFVVLSILPFVAFSQPSKVKIQKPSPWVKSVSFNSAALPAEGENASSYFLLVDEQENTATEEVYYHYAYKLLTNEGVQEMSDLSFDFDPQYQQLTLHHVKIHRGTQEINQIPKDIRTIQREESSDRYLYDGSLTAIINLKDVRKGDIIEYSFTRKGYNPAFGGSLSRVLYFNYGSPTEKIHYRYTVPDTKTLQMKFSRGEEVPYEKETSAGMTTYIWSFNKVAKYSNDSGAPDWADNGSYVAISDFKSWQDVATKTAGLFAVSLQELERLKNEANKLFKSHDIEKYAVEATRFVQDEVRYLGFETGLNSYKPHAPIKVYEQRFGDCKDKSLLLVTLLAARNIEAYPVLVNTSLKNNLEGRLPTNRLFDHCVVQVRMPGQTIYIDPTISNQGGSIYNYYFPSYGKGLVLSPDATGLTTLTNPVESATSEEQTYEVSSIGGEAMLTVTTSYSGRDADYQRSEFASTALATMQESYLKYYASVYPDITKWEDLKVEDDREKNIFTITEKYKIPTFWKPYTKEDGAENDHTIYSKVEPQTLSSYFDVSQSILQRKDPLSLAYPVNYRHTTRVLLPERWSIEEKNLNFDNSFYRYKYDLTSTGTEVTRVIHYQTKQDHVPVESLKTYLSDHQVMNNNLAYLFLYDKSISEAKSGYVGVLVTIFAVALGGWLTLRLYRKYDPKPYFARHEGIAIGGWLFLVALGVTLTPLRLLASIAQDADYYAQGQYQGFLAAGQYGFYLLGMFGHIFNLVAIMFAVMLVILFYQRRSSFPRLFSIFLVSNSVIVLATDLIWPLANTSFQPDYKSIFQNIIATAIWVPYMLISSRVKETFVNRSDNYDPETEKVDQEEMKEN